MLNPPSGVTLADYWSAIKAGNSQHIRMTFANGTVLDESDVLSDGFTIQDILNGDTDLTFGKAVMKQINIPFINSSRLNGLQWSTEFTLEMGVDISDSTKWVTVGKFHGERPDKIHYVDVINFTACDRMQWFEVEVDKFLKELSLPKTFSQILSALCAYIGVPYKAGDELTAIKSRSFDSGFINSEAVTCRDLIALMAEACGCYAKITADGKLKMVWYATASHSVSADQEFSIDAYDIGMGMTWEELSAYTWEEAEQFTWADVGGYNEVFRVNGLNVKQTEDDIGVLYGNHVGNIYLIVDNPFLVINENTDADTYVKPIYERLRDFGGYLPMNTQCIGDWLVESGDIITVDVHGDSVHMPVFCQTIHWNGGCTAVYEATGSIKREPISAGTRQKLTNGGKFHEFRNDIDQLSSRMGDAEGNISSIEQTVGGIETMVENSEGDISTLQQTASRIDATVEQKSRVFYSSTTPTGTTADPVETGDYWIDTAHNNATKRYNGSSWVDVSYDDPDIAAISLSVSKKARVYYSNTAPTGTTSDPLVTGDLWIDTANSNQLKRYNGSSWVDASFDDPDKYTVRSGIAITGNGVEVTGGKYVKIMSGGTFDVDATNFKISSADKYLKTGDWTINDSGIKYEYAISGFIANAKADFLIKKGSIDSSPSGTTYRSGISYDYTATSAGGVYSFTPHLYIYQEHPSEGKTAYIDISSNVDSNDNPYITITGTSIKIGTQSYPINSIYATNGNFTNISGSLPWSNLTGVPNNFPGGCTGNATGVSNKTTTETNFNNITASGTYWLSSPSSMTNKPSDYPGGTAMLEVNSNSNIEVFQKLYTEKRLYTRAKMGSSTWGSWYVEQRYTV